ncbi:MAG: hypothetical protein ACK5MW_00630 [Enterococcus sp.]
MGFSELVRRASKHQELGVVNVADDLLQMSQLRNAIIHKKISEDFVIAKPNDWALQHIHQIEQQLITPEKVIPRFQIFRENTTLEAVLITKQGHTDGNLMGIIRPRDLANELEES